MKKTKSATDKHSPIDFLMYFTMHQLWKKYTLKKQHFHVPCSNDILRNYYIYDYSHE